MHWQTRVPMNLGSARGGSYEEKKTARRSQILLDFLSFLMRVRATEQQTFRSAKTLFSLSYGTNNLQVLQLNFRRGEKS